MADHDTDALTAMQYLIWALEFIEKTGNEKAARQARGALKALREGSAGPSPDKYERETRPNTVHDAALVRERPIRLSGTGARFSLA
jgi:hypothetical protein